MQCLLTSEKCLQKCCINHGLPVECLEEKVESKKILPYNDSHHEIRLVRSEKCHFYAGIMKQCKLDCLKGNGETTKENVVVSSVELMAKFSRSSASPVFRYKGKVMGSGIKGKYFNCVGSIGCIGV